ncbi:MAG: TPM domain-containing protein [Candidatus Aenigmatarchaeota archaeon]
MKKTILILIFLMPIAFALNKPYLTKYVNDFANVLNDDCERQLNSLSNEIERQTTAEIVVVTMNSLCDERGCEDLEKYSNELFRQSGIGKKDKNNGLMILVFVDDKKYRIEVGYGLEGNIPDILANQVAERYMKPFFRENDYCSGLYNAVFQFGQEIKGEKNSTVFSVENDSTIRERPVQSESDVLQMIIALILIAGFVVFLYFVSKGSKSKRRSVIVFGGFGGGGSSGGGFGGGSSGGGGASGRW